MRATRPVGFTLIELLVVITIIVVLLALLTPALDKAIYEAEMAVDLAGMRGVASAATVYAMDQKRRYPYREDAHGEGLKFDFSSVNNVRDVRSGLNYDMRARMKDYWSLRALVGCPFSEEVDLEDDGSLGTTMISADYALFFGWQYTGQKGMFKAGDRFGIRGKQYSVLVADVDVSDTDNVLSWAAHPDNLQLGEMVWQNYGDPAREQARADAVAYGTLVNDPSFSWTYSRWDCRSIGDTGYPEWYRAPLDNNFAYADGSADRFNQIKVDPNTGELLDEGMGSAGFYRNGGSRLIIPVR